LWIDGLTDAMSLRMPAHRVPFYGALMKLADGIINVVGRIFFFLGRLLRLATVSTDTSTSVSDRSRLLWEEAIRRKFDMEQLLLAGKATDTFRMRRNGKTYFFKSIPLPVEASALRMDDKVLFKKLLQEAGLPVPRSIGVSNVAQAQEALAELSLVCIKPRTGSNGRHTYPFVRTPEEAEFAFRSVRKISPFASVEEHLEGNLCRATCVDGVMAGFLESEHPHVEGDGVSSIRELVATANQRKQEGTEDLVLDDSIRGYIRRRGYDLDSVLPAGERLQLSYRGGRSVASTNREHGRTIHPSFIPIIEKAAVLTELPVVGFDIIIPDPMRPASEQRWGFIEANSLPWIDLHANPYYGEPNDLSAPVWDMWERRYAR
jgi:D-alanine-D-alanine ligase-like ATP-grasp enzyme